jgi:hypothetical protein
MYIDKDLEGLKGTKLFIFPIIGFSDRLPVTMLL